MATSPPLYITASVEKQEIMSHQFLFFFSWNQLFSNFFSKKSLSRNFCQIKVVWERISRFPTMWICVVFVPEMFPWFAKMSGTNTCGTLFIVKDLNSPFSGNEAKSWKILVGTWSSSESKWSPLSVNGSPKRSRFPVWQLSNRKIILMAASFASDLLSEWRPYKLRHSVEI